MDDMRLEEQYEDRYTTLADWDIEDLDRDGDGVEDEPEDDEEDVEEEEDYDDHVDYVGTHRASVL